MRGEGVMLMREDLSYSDPLEKLGRSPTHTKTTQTLFKKNAPEQLPRKASNKHEEPGGALFEVTFVLSVGWDGIVELKPQKLYI